MLRHNLLLIYRNFLRFKGTFLINLVGLSTGLSCTLLIYLWVMDELSVDRYHEHSDRIYQVMEHRKRAIGIWTAESTSAPASESLTTDFPEIEYAAVHGLSNKVVLSVGDHDVEGTGRFVGRDYFKILSFDLIHGDKDRVLADNHAMAISGSMAVRLFGDVSRAVGKTVVMDHNQEFTITGVYRDLPATASDRPDYLWSFERFRLGKEEQLNNWGNTNVAIYLLLKPDADAAALNAKLADYVIRKTNHGVTHRTVFIRKYADKYLYNEYEDGVLTGGRITYVKLFSIIAVFIMVIACINFMNLSTAKASRRIKEVGIKKAIGASKGTLIYRYLSESLMLSLLSLLIALLAVDLLLPYFNDITGKHLTLRIGTVLLPGVGIALVTGLLAGSYPALYLSGFSPATVLKGKLNSSLGEVWARQGLVVFQFALSVIFITGVTVVYQQIAYTQSKNLGYEREGVIYFPRQGRLWQHNETLETFLEEVRRIPGVAHASATNHDMTGHYTSSSGINWPGKDPEDRTEFEVFQVDYDMMETLGLKMTQGRMFSRDYHPDTSRVIFNEAAIAFMNMQQPVGKTVRMWDKNVEIVGVVKNFHYESLHEPLKPVVFRYEPQRAGHIMVRLQAGEEKATLARLATFYSSFNEGFTLDYRFLDEDYRAQYAAEQRVSILSRYFAGLAILISCLGLFGLAAFTAERRLKEIGIRKVLGSSNLNVVLLLSGDFTRIVIIAIAVAVPVSYFFTHWWLSTFAFRITLQWWYFAGAGVLALVICWLTVGSQAIKAAQINPAKCLKEQ